MSAARRWRFPKEAPVFLLTWGKLEVLEAIDIEAECLVLRLPQVEHDHSFKVPIRAIPFYIAPATPAADEMIEYARAEARRKP